MRKFIANLFLIFIIMFVLSASVGADTLPCRTNTVLSNFTYNLRVGNHVRLSVDSKLCGHILYFYNAMVLGENNYQNATIKICRINEEEYKNINDDIIRCQGVEWLVKIDSHFISKCECRKRWLFNR